MSCQILVEQYLSSSMVDIWASARESRIVDSVKRLRTAFCSIDFRSEWCIGNPSHWSSGLFTFGIMFVRILSSTSSCLLSICSTWVQKLKLGNRHSLVQYSSWDSVEQETAIKSPLLLLLPLLLKMFIFDSATSVELWSVNTAPAETWSSLFKSALSLLSLISGRSFPSLRIKENTITGLFVATAVIKAVKASPSLPSVAVISLGVKLLDSWLKNDDVILLSDKLSR